MWLYKLWGSQEESTQKRISYTLRYLTTEIWSNPPNKWKDENISKQNCFSSQSDTSDIYVIYWCLCKMATGHRSFCFPVTRRFWSFSLFAYGCTSSGFVLAELIPISNLAGALGMAVTFQGGITKEGTKMLLRPEDRIAYWVCVFVLVLQPGELSQLWLSRPNQLGHLLKRRRKTPPEGQWGQLLLVRLQ